MPCSEKYYPPNLPWEIYDVTVPVTELQRMGHEEDISVVAAFRYKESAEKVLAMLEPRRYALKHCGC